MNVSISEVQKFHGHMCPGLAIGIRVAEAAMAEMGERPGDEEVVAIVETDNCAVDAIQFITGCTFGKGNLIHLDYGKNAFRFIRRSDGKAVRIRVLPIEWKASTPQEEETMSRWRMGTASAEEKHLAEGIQQRRSEAILKAPLQDVVEVQSIQPVVPEKARIFNSLTCAGCGEKTMETRLHSLEGELYCPECYQVKLLVR